MTDDSDRNGMEKAMSFRDFTVLASPIHKKPTGSANENSTAMALSPKNRLYAKQRRIAAATLQLRSCPSSSETNLVAAKRMPETAKVVHKNATERTNWYSPIPAEPMRPASQTWNAMEMALIASEDPVSRAVFIIKRFLLTIHKNIHKNICICVEFLLTLVYNVTTLTK